MEPGEKRRGASAALWVLIVLLVGLGVGLVASVIPSPTGGTWPGRGSPWGLRFETAADIDVVLSTVSAALLVSLVVVYARTYQATRAAFVGGLTVVLVALLLETILTSPLVYGIFGETAGGLGVFLMLASLFKVTAFSGFLYLSLQ